MINTQFGRRNLPPAQRLAVMDKFKKKIQEQAADKASESRSKFHGNQYTEVSSPNGDHTKIKPIKNLQKWLALELVQLLLLLGGYAAYLFLILWCAYDFWGNLSG